MLFCKEKVKRSAPVVAISKSNQSSGILGKNEVHLPTIWVQFFSGQAGGDGVMTTFMRLEIG